MLRRSVAIAVLATAVVALSVQVVGADTSQSWRLLHDTYLGTKAIDGTTHHYDRYMNKTDDTTVTPYSMTLPNVTEKTTWWYAEYPAQFDGLTFGEDKWVINISHTQASDYTIFANVSKVADSTGEVTYLANGSSFASATGVTIITCYDNQNTQQIFNTGERLALRVYHNRATTLRIYYYNATDGKNSNLTSPSSDPGYPIPELPPLILLATGLLALAGYALLKKGK